MNMGFWSLFPSLLHSQASALVHHSLATFLSLSHVLYVSEPQSCSLQPLAHSQASIMFSMALCAFLSLDHNLYNPLRTPGPWSHSLYLWGNGILSSSLGLQLLSYFIVSNLLVLVNVCLVTLHTWCILSMHISCISHLYYLDSTLLCYVSLYVKTLQCNGMFLCSMA